MKTETNESKEEVELTEVVTQTSSAFKLPDGTVTDANGLFVWIANQVLKIKRAVS